MAVSERALRVGTRGSALALEQTRRVVAALARVAPGVAIETRPIATAGDRDKQTPLAIIGGQGVFAKELQLALLAGEIDLAVHSLKDLTSTLPAGLTLGAIVERADPRDALVSRDGQTLADLPAGARVGTSSRRRIALLRRLRPDLQTVDLRGNVDTRLRKVRAGEVDAAILAAAGLARMGYDARISEYLPIAEFVPAPGQGALAVECRASDADLLDLLRRIHDPRVGLAVAAERAFLRAIGGGCSAPVGAHAWIEGNGLRLRAMLADEAMTRVAIETRECALAEAEAAAADLAAEMKRRLGLAAEESAR